MESGYISIPTAPAALKSGECQRRAEPPGRLRMREGGRRLLPPMDRRFITPSPVAAPSGGYQPTAGWKSPWREWRSSTALAAGGVCSDKGSTLSQGALACAGTYFAFSAFEPSVLRH